MFIKNNNNSYNFTKAGPIQPTDVKIYYEDSVPYLDYTGTCLTDKGMIKIHIPKLGLKLQEITKTEEYTNQFAYDRHDVPLVDNRILISQQIYAVNDELATFEVIEREMTKEQIEKEFGYKIKIME